MELLNIRKGFTTFRWHFWKVASAICIIWESCSLVENLANICGASVVVCGCLAAYDYKLFERFCRFHGIRQSADLNSIKY